MTKNMYISADWEKQEDIIRKLINDGDERIGKTNLKMFYRFNRAEYIEYSFHKIEADPSLNKKETTFVKINMNVVNLSNVNGDDYGVKTLIFDIYGNEMLPYSDIICKDDVIGFVKNLSKVTKMNYTFHVCSIPIFTINNGKSIFWNTKELVNQQ